MYPVSCRWKEARLALISHSLYLIRRESVQKAHQGSATSIDVWCRGLILRAVWFSDTDTVDAITESMEAVNWMSGTFAILVS